MQKLPLSPDMGLSKALVYSVLVGWVVLFSFSSLCSSGIICGPISTAELIWAADGSCRLITGLKSLPNGNSCDLLFVNLLTHGKHYPSASLQGFYIDAAHCIISMTCRDKINHMRLEVRRPAVPKTWLPSLAWKHTTMERLPDKNWCPDSG